MSDAVSFAEIDEQHVEFLPARTVMSVFSMAEGGGTGGAGGDGKGGIGGALLSGIGILAEGNANTANGTGGAGGSVYNNPPAQ